MLVFLGFEMSELGLIKKSVFLKHEKLNLKNFDQGLAEDFLPNEGVFYLSTLSELMDTWVTTCTRSQTIWMPISQTRLSTRMVMLPFMLKTSRPSYSYDL